MKGRARDEGVSFVRSSTSKEFRRGFKVGSGRVSLIIEEGRRLPEVKCWEMITLEMCE